MNGMGMAQTSLHGGMMASARGMRSVCICCSLILGVLYAAARLLWRSQLYFPRQRKKERKHRKKPDSSRKHKGFSSSHFG